jgi:hypothetical protein
MAGYKVNFAFTFTLYDKIHDDWCMFANVSKEIFASVSRVLNYLEDGVSKLHCTVHHVLYNNTDLHQHRCEDPTWNVTIFLEKPDLKCLLRKDPTSLLKM